MFGRTFSTIIVSSLASGLSHAQLPDVAQHIPSSAPMAIVVPSLNALNDQVQTALAALEMPGMFTLEQGLATIGIREGLDFNGSAAVIIPMSAIENEGEGIVGLVPVSDFGAFINQFNAQKNHGIYTFVMNDEQTFAKPLGNYAVLSDSSATVAAFTGKGNADALEAKMGTSVHKIADSSGVFLMVNHEPLAFAIKPLIEDLKKEIETDLANGNGMNELPGVSPELVLEMIDMGFDTLQDFFDQSTMTIVGAEISAFGYSIDAATSFTPGSTWGNVFSAQGDASVLFALLPNKSFIFASAFDISMPQFKDMFTSMMEDFSPLIEQLVDAGGEQFAGMLDPNLIRLTDGQTMAMFVPEGGFMSGLLSGTVKIDVSNEPVTLHNIMRKVLSSGKMNDATEYSIEEDAVNVGSTKADSWSVNIGAALGNNPMLGQFMGMAFGPSGGPSGLMASGPKGVYTTYSQKASAMESLLGVTAQNSLGTDPSIQQVRGFLPEHCMAEFYFSPQATIDMLLPMAAMFGMQIDIPDLNMPPIASGIATGNNEVHAKLFVPMPVIKGFGQIAKAVQEQMQGPGGDQGNPPF